MQIPSPAGLIEIHRQGQLDGCGSVEVAGFAPVKARMGQENRRATYGERRKAQRVDPVGGADQPSVTHTEITSYTAGKAYVGRLVCQLHAEAGPAQERRRLSVPPLMFALRMLIGGCLLFTGALPILLPIPTGLRNLQNRYRATHHSHMVIDLSLNGGDGTLNSRPALLVDRIRVHVIIYSKHIDSYSGRAIRSLVSFRCHPLFAVVELLFDQNHSCPKQI